MPTNICMKHVRPVCCLIVALSAALLPMPAVSSIEDSIARLKLDFAAFQAAQNDFRTQRELNGLDGTEATDYAAYVARLQRRVFEDCREVAEAESPLPEDLPCPVEVTTVTESADIAIQAEQTPAEQIAALDRSNRRTMI